MQINDEREKSINFSESDSEQQIVTMTFHFAQYLVS